MVRFEAQTPYIRSNKNAAAIVSILVWHTKCLYRNFYPINSHIQGAIIVIVQQYC